MAANARFAVGTFLAFCSPLAFGQTTTPPPSETQDRHSGAPLLQFAVGPAVVTPTFRIGTLAFDTNVRYTQERQADFLASAGPGLDIEVPFADHWKFAIDSSAQYMYFHRTEELRRWTGGGGASLFWATTGTRASLRASAHKDFSRTGFEVDERIERNTISIDATLSRKLGRLTLSLLGSGTRTDLADDQKYRGADLTRAFTTDRLDSRLELEYSLTPISSLLLEGSYEQTHFPLDKDRNYAQELGGIGIRTNGLFEGSATVGVRHVHLVGEWAGATRPYFRADLRQSIGNRIRLGERYTHESMVSAFAAKGEVPTIENRSLNAAITVVLNRRIDIRLSGTRSRLLSDGAVQVIDDAGNPVRAKRDDTIYIADLDLGMRLGRSRTSVFVSYTTRDSLYFSDFGIEGLQAGARVEYTPGR